MKYDPVLRRLEQIERQLWRNPHFRIEQQRRRLRAKEAEQVVELVLHGVPPSEIYPERVCEASLIAQKMRRAGRT